MIFGTNFTRKRKIQVYKVGWFVKVSPKDQGSSFFRHELNLVGVDLRFF